MEQIFGQREEGEKALLKYLMAYDKDVLLPLEFHDDRLKTNNDVAIRLSTSIPIIKLVFITVREIIRICLLLGIAYY